MDPRTGWFRGINPFRRGAYECRFAAGGKITLRYWNGKRWLTEKGGKPSLFGRDDRDQWRGLFRG